MKLIKVDDTITAAMSEAIAIPVEPGADLRSTSPLVSVRGLCESFESVAGTGLLRLDAL